MSERPRSTDRPVPILWLTKGLGRGGTERLLVDCLAEVDRDRFEIHVAYLLPWKDALVADLEAQGARVHCLDSTGPGRITWVRRLRSIVARHGIQLIHSHAPHPALGARLVVPWAIPIVHTEHNVWPRYRPLTKITNAWTYGRNGAVIAVSGAVAETIRPPRACLGKHPPVTVIHHGTTIARRPAPGTAEDGRSLLGLSDRGLVIGTVANFTPKKNHHGLLAAFSDVLVDHPDTTLVLIGSGPLEEDLRADVSRRGLAERVVFTGMRDDVPNLLPAFDVFVLASTFEGFPISLVEAMATGLACVATTVGGIPEVIDDDVNGLLIAPKDTAALAGALRRVLGDAELANRLGRAAAERALTLDLGTAVHTTQELYDDLIGAC